MPKLILTAMYLGIGMRYKAGMCTVVISKN